VRGEINIAITRSCPNRAPAINCTTTGSLTSCSATVERICLYESYAFCKSPAMTDLSAWSFIASNWTRWARSHASATGSFAAVAGAGATACGGGAAGAITFITTATSTASTPVAIAPINPACSVRFIPAFGRAGLTFRATDESAGTGKPISSSEAAYDSASWPSVSHSIRFPQPAHLAAPFGVSSETSELKPQAGQMIRMDVLNYGQA
jgi:hypothetical protein